MIVYLGYLAGIITVAAFLPQVFRILRTRQTKDLSLGMFSLLMGAGSLWMVYGFMNRDWPVVMTNLGMVSLNGVMAGAKIRFERGMSASG